MRSSSRGLARHWTSRAGPTRTERGSRPTKSTATRTSNSCSGRVSGNFGASAGGNAIPNSGTITCSSDNGKRNYCAADTRGGVRLVRQISGSPCQEGSTWGYDSRGIWVDRGCRAEFGVSGSSTGGAVITNLGAGRTDLKPGWNMFSPQQDIELGQQASGEVAGQVLMLNDSRVDKYLNKIGQRLSAHTPGLRISVHVQSRQRPGDQRFCTSRRAHLHQPRRD